MYLQNPSARSTGEGSDIKEAMAVWHTFCTVYTVGSLRLRKAIGDGGHMARECRKNAAKELSVAGWGAP